MEQSNNLLSAKEVSELLGINLRTVQRLTKQGKIKGIRVGKLWKYNKTDIDKYLSVGTDFSREPIRLNSESNILSLLFSIENKTGKQVERRAYSRINCNFKCNYSINLQPLKQIASQGIIKNISAGGIFVLSQNNNEIAIDDPISLQFNLDPHDGNTFIKSEGKVIRKDAKGVGIKFRNLNEEYKNRIIEYIG